MMSLINVIAGVAELADAQDLKSCGPLKLVPVRFRSPAPVKYKMSRGGAVGSSSGS